MKCSGNDNEICGGSDANSVYSTQKSMPGFLGCYLDSNPRDLPLLTLASSANNVELCVSTCANMGYKYAAVQFGYAIILKIFEIFFLWKTIYWETHEVMKNQS